MSKINVFLGGYINYTNAQNLNCRALAEYLDKDKFEVFTLTTYFGKKEGFDFRTFNCFRPFIFSKQLGFLWGILNCDVAYLPKHVDTPLWVLKIARMLRKPIFTTIEGNVTDLSLPNLIFLFGSKNKMKNYFSYFNQVFGITYFLIKKTKEILDLQENALFLGVNTDQFCSRIVNKLESIVFVGGLIDRKRVSEFLELAKLYPQIVFNIIGNGSEENKLKKNKQSNVVFHGELTQNQINRIFQKTDLMFLPAKSEGFPKVILEAASAGIPSIVYDAYGASNWMNHKENGFIVEDFAGVKSIVNELLENHKLLQQNSENAIELARHFDWRNIIKDWEEIIIKLYNG